VAVHVPDINSIINDRAGIKFSNDIHNALGLLGMVIRGVKRGTYPSAACYMEGYEGTTTHDRGRKKYYARWLRNMRIAGKRRIPPMPRPLPSSC
jgi:hypothetical protein